MHCYECPYTSKVQRKYGVTTHCNLEPTNMDVTFHIMKKDNNKLCPFVCKGTRFPGVDYSKYIDEKSHNGLEDNTIKGKYRGCDIEVERGGAEFLTFAVFDDGYEVTSGFSESSDTVRDYYSYMKSVVDDYKEHPEDYE